MMSSACMSKANRGQPEWVSCIKGSFTVGDVLWAVLMHGVDAILCNSIPQRLARVKCKVCKSPHLHTCSIFREHSTLFAQISKIEADHYGL